ncbi:MAG: hypothetical protein ABIG93_02905 [archaeon]|nr:hypothetical protein [Nanoarchaeota archaeon]
MKSCVDLVIGGPDMSGTSTQVKSIVQFFRDINWKIRDLRGSELHALFHAQRFSKFNQNHERMQDFLNDPNVPEQDKQEFISQSMELLHGGGTNQDLQVASCINNSVSTYIDPNSADVWVMEEPTKRGAGQVNRTIEQQRTKYGSSLHPVAAALSHQAYRTDEFLRFRKALREANKVIIRSRSEESACYQIYNPVLLPQGISREDYLNLPGHKFAFSYAPTHLFIVCAGNEWKKEQYLQLKKQRSGGRDIDDHEKNADYQLFVNRRYSQEGWLEGLYQDGVNLHGGKVPELTRFNIYGSITEIKQQMLRRLFQILKENAQQK